jgi:glycosyltransferase involved in cell wall biosynthesis
MNIAFAHDNTFFPDGNGRIHSIGHFGYPLWERYLKHFGTVTAIGRSGAPVLDEQALAGLSLSSGPGVRFRLVRNFSHPLLKLTRQAEAARAIAATLAGADGLIARLPSEVGSLAVEICQRLGKPWAAEVVSCAWDALWNHGSWQGKAYAPWAFLRTRRLVAASRYTLYVTDRFLQGRYPAHGHTAGVSDVVVQPPGEEVVQARRNRIAAGGPPLVFGLIGAYNLKYKGLHTALEALSGIKDRLPRFELSVLGPGDPEPWGRTIRSLGLEGRVDFHGTLPGGGPVLRWLDGVDIYLQPSFQEGLPRALIEAMSRGCPAAGSTAGGIPELLPEELLHRPGDAARLGTQLLRLATDPGLRTRSSERGFAVARRYEIGALTPRRDAFWSAFADHVRASKPGRAPGSGADPGHAPQRESGDPA